MDWNDLRDFLAISRHGTLSAAALALGVQQSTMGRRLKALEARVGAKLLQRTRSGFVLTAAGEAILEKVERIESEALGVERAISGKDARLEGVVRMTATENLTVEVLTPILAEFDALYPDITIEFIAESRQLDLATGEADIALRLSRFTQYDLSVRKAADLAFAAYASPAYIAARGVPNFDRGAPAHRLIVPQEALSATPEALWFAALTGAGNVALRSNSSYMRLAAAEAGMGIACLPRFLGDAAPLSLLRPLRPAPCRELWLGIHRDLRLTPRFRAIVDFLAAGLRQRAAMLNPEEAAA